MEGDYPVWLTRKFPRNYIFRHPVSGALLIMVFCFVFLILYIPLGARPGRHFSYGGTMAIYSIVAGLSVLGTIRLLRRIPFFSDEYPWSAGKELSAIIITLSATGVAIYLAGFFLEEPFNRLNLPTFLNSVRNAFLIGIIPFGFFILSNYRHWPEESAIPKESAKEQNHTAGEVPVKIISQLKKEELSFYPRELIYVASESNYVNFYLLRDNKVQKQVIRNSINNIEEQLSGIPFLFRTHRAFIVNIKQIRTKRGNSLGYQLKLIGIDEEIPVSRNNTKPFTELCRKFK